MFRVFNICQDAAKRRVIDARDLRGATNVARAMSMDFHGKFVVQSGDRIEAVWSDGRNVSGHYTGSVPRIKWLAAAQRMVAA